jgi:hypothetical protein
MSDDLMGTYAAYTSPNAALQDLATTNAAQGEQASVSIITFSLVTFSLITES